MLIIMNKDIIYHSMVTLRSNERGRFSPLCSELKTIGRKSFMKHGEVEIYAPSDKYVK